MPPLERIGFEATIDKVQQYLAQGAQINQTNDKIAASLRNLEQVSERVSIHSQNADARIAESKRRLQVIEEQVARARERALARVERAQARAARTDIVRKPETQANLEASARAAQLALKDVEAAGAARIASGQADVQAALRNSGNVAVVAGQQMVNAEARKARALETSGNAVRRAVIGFGPFRAAAHAASQTTAAFGRALIATTGFSNRFAVSLRFGAVALAAFSAGFTISTAAKFEDSLAKIDNLTNATRQETEDLGKAILNLSRTVPKSPDELGAAAYIILSSGIDNVKDGFEILEATARAAVGGFADVAVVARATTAILNAYGRGNINAAQATDILFAAARAGAVEFNDMAGAVGRVAPLSRQLGIEFDQLAAALATMTNAGLSAEQATTGVLGIINQLQSPSKEAEEILNRAFGNVNNGIQRLRANIAERGLIPALQEVFNLLGNNITAIENLFPEVRGLNAALFLSADAGRRYAKVLDDVQHSEGIAEKAFRRANETFNNQARLLQNQVTRAMINIGATVLPELNREIQKLTAFLDANQDGIRRLAQDILSFSTTVIVGFVKGLQTINDALRFIPNNYLLITAAIATIGIAMVAAFGPASAAFAALAGLIALIGLLKEEMASAAQSIADFTGLPGPSSGVTAGIREAKTPQQLRSELEKEGAPEWLIRRSLEELDKSQKRAAASTSSLDDQINKIAESARGGKQDLTEVSSNFNDLPLPETAKNALTLKDALSDLTISFQEAKELGIDAIQAGAQEARFVFEEADEAAFNFTKTLSKVANAFLRSEQAANRLVQALVREALEKSQQALAALTGRPTQEVAALELAIAELEAKRAQVAISIIPQIEALQDQLDALRARRDRSTRGRGREAEPREPNEQILGQVLESGLNTNLGSLGTAAGSAADALEEEEKAIQDQIEALQKQLEGYDRQGEAIQRQIDIYKTQTEILVKQAQLADKTLLTQAEQHEKLREVIAAISEQSQNYRRLSEILGEDVVPEMNEFRKAVSLAREAMAILNDPTLRQQFIPAILQSIEETNGQTSAIQRSKDAHTKNAEAVEQATGKFKDFITTIGFNFIADFNRKVNETFDNVEKKFDQSFGQVPSQAVAPDFPFQFPTIEPQQHGGLITRPTLAMLGERRLPELVLPLSNPGRSQQLIRSLPPSLSAAFRNQGRLGSLFGDLNISGGPVPREIENLVVFEVRRELSRTRRGVHNAGFRV